MKWMAPNHSDDARTVPPASMAASALEQRRQALGGMMLGLFTTWAAFLLALVSPALAAPAQTSASSDVIGYFLLPLLILLALACLYLVARGLRETGAAEGQSNSPKTSASEPSDGQLGPAAVPEASAVQVSHQLQDALRRSARQGSPLAMLMICADPGERALDPTFAEAMARTVTGLSHARAGRPLRIDRSRFLVLFANTPLDTAMASAEDYRQAVSDMGLSEADNSDAAITVSVALLACHPGFDDRAETWLNQAAEAIELARARGGNRVEQAGAPVGSQAVLDLRPRSDSPDQ